MKPFLKLFWSMSFLGLGAMMGVGATPRRDEVRVIATLTDLADFARNIGGNHVNVRSLATGVEGTHGVPLKPSFVPSLNPADLVLLVGFGCEHSFLPPLLEASKNPGIQYGMAGYIHFSKGIVPA